MKQSKKQKKQSTQSGTPATSSIAITRRIDELNILIPHCRNEIKVARQDVQKSAALTEPDPCADIRLEHLGDLLAELVLELQLLQANLKSMDSGMRLMACEMANMPGDTDGMPDDPPTPEAP